MRKILATIALSSLPLVASATTPPITSINVEVLEGKLAEGWYRPSVLGVSVARSNPAESRFVDQYQCLELGNGDCGYDIGTNISYFATLVFPPCTSSEEGPCIEKFELKKDEGTWQEARYVRSIYAPTRKSEPQISFPSAGSMSLWRSDSISHSGGENTYAIYVVTEGGASKNSPIVFSGVQARIIPYNEVSGSFAEQVLSATRLQDYPGFETGKQARVSTSSFEKDSVWSDRLGRGVIAEWSRETSARLTLRVPVNFNGWIGGRLSGVDFELSKYSERLNRLRISGAPVSIAEVKLSIPTKEIPQKFKEIYPIEDPPIIAGYFLGGATHRLSSRVIDAVRDYAGDKATRSRTYWGFESVDATSNKCLADTSRIVGVVSTDALVYTNSAPTFADGKLKYAVASMHRDERGVEIRGSYDLVLRSDAARCLYGFSNAPIEAVVSVTYGDKEENISTTSTGERNGWLFISAKNFTYSNPTIEVAISQPKPMPTVAQPPTSMEKQSVKKSITCVKGTAVKKVTGKSPKCPKGFKKRA